MGFRNIVEKGDGILLKHCRPVKVFDQKLHTLLDDMRETLIKTEGVGLAAPQVGILRRVILVQETNVPEGEEYFIEIINPELVEQEGTQEGPEGCLSLPGIYGWVARPERVKIRAQDRMGNWFELDGDGLTARTICHEMDHLEGVLFDDIADHIMSDDEIDEYYRQEELKNGGQLSYAEQKRRKKRKERRKKK